LGLSPKEFAVMSFKEYVLLCIGHRRKRIVELQSERELKYVIMRGWATKLPKMQELFPIAGEPIIKPKPLNKRQAQRMKDFNSYILSGKWRKKQNG